MDFTIFTSKQILSKRFSLIDGQLQKYPGGNMTEGVVQRLTVGKPEHLKRILNALTPNNALALGVCQQYRARIVAQAMLGRADPCADMPTIARTAENVRFAEGLPGIFMLDVDVPKDGTPPLTRPQALGLVKTVCPAFADAPMVMSDSASSHIINSEAGEVLKGAGGLRIYAFVMDASDIPRAGMVLFKRLILAGYIRIEIGKAGTFLVRGPIDNAVFKGEHLDFAGGAYCQPPLEQRRPAPEVFNNNAPFLDTRQALPDLSTSEEAEYQRLVDAAKARKKPEAEQVREAWLISRTETEMNLRGMTLATHPEEARVVRERLTLAANTNTLEKDFVLYLKDGQSITVGELLADREKYDGVRLGDPIDPGCYNDWRIAVALLTGTEPKIYSHAHGGTTYYLQVIDANDFDVVGDEVGATKPSHADDKKKPCQLELAREVIACIGAENVLHDGRSFWRWKDRGVWARIDDREIKRVVQDVLEAHGKVLRSAVDSVTDIAKTETFSPVLLEPTQPFVNCQNGELHWTGTNWEIQHHQKDHLAISQIPVDWAADAECPRFEKFLEEIFTGDDDAQEKRQLLLELIGYSLVPSAEFEKFALLVGNGANGKSVVLQVLQALLGAENCASVSPAQFDNRFQRAHLHGKLANLVSELPEGSVLADAELKAIVSGELITAEHKMQTPFDFRPTCTVWFATNHMPGTRDFSDAIFRRACVLKFNRKFEEHEQDTQLKSKLTQELSGILRVALDAYGRVLLRGGFTLPASVVEARQEWRLDADQVAAFIEDEVERVAGEKTDSQTVYANYRQWANGAGISRLLGRKAFTQRMERLGFETGRGTGGVRVVWGVRVKAPATFWS